jgi:ethanolamine utilization protein EutN
VPWHRRIRREANGTQRVPATIGPLMQIGQVIGQGVSTIKHPSLQGWRLLLVQPLRSDSSEDGEPFLAIDMLGAGNADRVILSNDGAGARELIGDKNSPVRWMIVGVCD